MTDSAAPAAQESTNSLSFAEILDVAGVRFALVLTADGLLKHRSRGIDLEQAEKLAAAASGMRGLAHALQEAGGIDGGLRQVMVEYAGPDDRGGLAIIRDAADGTRLMVVAEATVDTAGLGRAIAHYLTAIGEWYLAEPDRASA